MNENLRHWLNRLKILIYLGVVFVVFIIFIVELKHTNNINIFPNVNGKVDDIYFEVKNKYFKD
jgi:hypothetical protein